MEIGQEALAHMSPERKSLVAQQEKVLSCPILSAPPHPLLSSSAPLLLLPHSSSHLLSRLSLHPLTSSSSAPSPLLSLLYSSPLPILSFTDGVCDFGDTDGTPCDYDDGDGAADGNVDVDDCAGSAMTVLVKLAERARVYERARVR